jgi:hypothetical protein
MCGINAVSRAGTVHLEAGVAAHVVGAGGDVEIVLVGREHRHHLVLRHVALRIEDNADARAVLDGLANSVIVDVETHFRAGFHQPARAVRIDLAVPADRVLVEHTAHRVVAAGIDQEHHRVMHHARRAGSGLGFNRP